MKQLLIECGIDALLDFVLSGAEWSNTTEEILIAAEKIVKHRKKLADIGIHLTCGKKTTTSPNTIVGALLNNLFGFKTTKRQRRRSNGKVIGFYSLDPSDLQHTKEDVLRFFCDKVNNQQLSQKNKSKSFTPKKNCSFLIDSDLLQEFTATFADQKNMSLSEMFRDVISSHIAQKTNRETDSVLTKQ